MWKVWCTVKPPLTNGSHTVIPRQGNLCGTFSGWLNTLNKSATWFYECKHAMCGVTWKSFRKGGEGIRNRYSEITVKRGTAIEQVLMKLLTYFSAFSNLKWGQWQMDFFFVFFLWGSTLSWQAIKSHHLFFLGGGGDKPLQANLKYYNKVLPFGVWACAPLAHPTHLPLGDQDNLKIDRGWGRGGGGTGE